MVAYALQITDLDPIAHQLLFERFLNPERVSMPDVDIDFCMEGRERVIAYVAAKYGADALAQIITLGTLGAKAVVRDVGRVLGHTYGFVDKLAKLIPFELGMTLDKALQSSAALREAYATDEAVTTLIDRARQLEGLTRHIGTHAGGVVIAPGALTDFTPLYCEAGGANPVTQFDKDDIEHIGLVKFDFLGRRTLTIIAGTLRTIAAWGAAAGTPPLDLAQLDPQDPVAFALLQRGETTAVFQLESRGMKELIRKLQPDCFEDLVALVALFRPGPLQSGMVEDFIARKHGHAPLAHPHPTLEALLQRTYGIILYQEQVMQIAQVLAGYSLGGADLLRRAMGKKKPAEMARQRAVFEQGAAARGVAPEVAQRIFDLIDKFAGYGFTRSHSAAHALLAYQTLWLKAHYPAPFMAAVLTAEMDNTDQVVTLLTEVRRLGLAVLPPDLNRSAWGFTAVSTPAAVRYGLGAIKGLGASAVGTLGQVRNQGGPFRDVWDPCHRLAPAKVPSAVLETLVRSGALDALGANRATLAQQLPLALKLAAQFETRRQQGQGDLFAAPTADAPTPEPALAAPTWPDWPLEERLAGERATLGCYLSQHPLDRYADELPHLATRRIGALLAAPAPRTAVTLIGLVLSLRHAKTRSGPMATLRLDDGTGVVEVALYGAVYPAHVALLAVDALLVVTGVLRHTADQPEPQRVARRLVSLGQARQAHATTVHLEVDLRDPAAQAATATLREQLQAILRAAHDPAGLPVTIRTRKPAADTTVTLGAGWRIAPTETVLADLRALLGAPAVSVRDSPRGA